MIQNQTSTNNILSDYKAAQVINFIDYLINDSKDYEIPKSIYDYQLPTNLPKHSEISSSNNDYLTQPQTNSYVQTDYKIVQVITSNFNMFIIFKGLYIT